MDFESPDVEKDFPGLYASETGRKSNESDFSDNGDHDKPSKKDLLGRRKEKKEKKDRGYAALEGESSPEEDTDTKSPSKTKKTKSFKFPTKSKEKREKSRDKEKVADDGSKHKEQHDKDKKKEKEREKEKKEKEKREKLREKDKEKEEKAKFKLESKEKLKDEKKDKVKDKDKEKCKEKEKEKEKIKEKDKEKGKEKEKDKGKEKEKDKGKEKEKDKKDKKLTKVPSTVTSGVPFEEIFTLGVALPIFGVPLNQSVERSRCHDDTGLPLVVRDSIDYLQAHGLKSPQIYRAEPDKIKLQQLRKLYTDRGTTYPYHWDVAVACAILKAFISELPSPILGEQRAQAEAVSVLPEPQRGTALAGLLHRLPAVNRTCWLDHELPSPILGEQRAQAEAVSVLPEPQRGTALAGLIHRLPAVNRTLLAWLIVHLHQVQLHQNVNHVTVEHLATVMGPALNMSHTLLKYMITNADTLFPDTELTRYIPPLSCMPTSMSPTELAQELRKQESLLAQIHAELHAGFSTPARDQQLWEAQRIVTQLKRKLRTVQKSVDPTPQTSQQQSIDEKPTEEEPQPTTSQTIDVTPQIHHTKDIHISPIPPPVEIRLSVTPEKTHSPKSHEQTFSDDAFEDNFDISTPSDLVLTPPEEIKPKLSEKELKLLRLQLENAEYLQLKSLLQAKINSEQFEIVKLRSHVALKNKQESNNAVIKESKMDAAEELELKQKLAKENLALEQKVSDLCNQIFQERVACIQLKIDLAMKEIL